MPAVGHVLEAAPAVGDLLVLGERVGDEGEQADVVLEHLRQRLRGGLAARTVGVREEIQGGLQGQRRRLALHLEAQAGHGLVEQPVPGAAGGERLLVEQPLQPLLQLVGLLLAQVIEPRLVAGHGRRLQGGRQLRVVQAVDLQLEEQEIGGDGGQPLLDVAVEAGVLGIAAVRGIEQAGVGAELAQGVAQGLVGGDGVGERRALPGQRRQPALVGRLDAPRLRGGLPEVRLHRLRLRAGIEVAQVPDRHRPEIDRLRGRRLPEAVLVGCAHPILQTANGAIRRPEAQVHITGVHITGPTSLIGHGFASPLSALPRAPISLRRGASKRLSHRFPRPGLDAGRRRASSPLAQAPRTSRTQGRIARPPPGRPWVPAFSVQGSDRLLCPVRTAPVRTGSAGGRTGW